MAGKARVLVRLEIGFHRAVGQHACTDGDACSGIAAHAITDTAGWRAAVGPGGADQQIFFADIVANQIAVYRIVDGNYFAV